MAEPIVIGIMLGGADRAKMMDEITNAGRSQAPANSRLGTEAGLAAASAKAREEALRQLRGDLGRDSVREVGEMLLGDTNANVRRTAANVLGKQSPEAVEYLISSLRRSDEETFVRRAVAQSLGCLRAEAAIDALAGVANGGVQAELAGDCVAALGAIHTAGAVAALSDLVPKLRPEFVQARAVTALGDMGDVDRDAVGVGAVRSLVRTGDTKVAKAVSSALAKLRPADAVSQLQILLDHREAGVRVRAAAAIGEFAAESADATNLLVAVLLDDPERGVRQAAAEALRLLPASPVLIEAVVRGLESSHAERSTFDPEAVAAALETVLSSAEHGPDRVAEILIAASVDANERVTGLIAAILIAACGRDADVVGELVNRYERAHVGTSEYLKRLRVEVGGTSALEPLFVKLRHDLETYFQKPIYELNNRTQEGWQDAVHRARVAFTVRLVMSVVVFGIGVCLVIASAVAFLTGDLNTAQAWGTGGSFVAGITSMFAVTYSGPLKDVRQSVRDVASANAVFIGYVHQVLEVSHTFSYLYLQEQISYGDLERSTKLLREATREAVDLFATDGDGRSSSAEGRTPG